MTQARRQPTAPAPKDTSIAAPPPRRRTPWSPAEDAAIRAARAAGWPPSRIAETLPGRTAASVKARLRALGAEGPSLGDWPDADLARLRDGYACGRRVAEIAADVGRSAVAVRRKARALGLVHPDRPSPYRPDEIAFLSRAYGRSHTPEQAAAALGRSLRSVYNEAHALGLSRKRAALASASEVGRYRRLVARGLDESEIAAELGCSRKALRAAAATRGLPAPTPKPATRYAAEREARGRRAAPQRPRDPIAHDAVAAFLAENGATRPQDAPAERARRALQRRDYAVVQADGLWVVDGRLRFADADLVAFAERRLGPDALRA